MASSKNKNIYAFISYVWFYILISLSVWNTLLIWISFVNSFLCGKYLEKKKYFYEHPVQKIRQIKILLLKKFYVPIFDYFLVDCFLFTLIFVLYHLKGTDGESLDSRLKLWHWNLSKYLISETICWDIIESSTHADDLALSISSNEIAWSFSNQIPS